DRSQPCPYDFIGLFCWSQWGKRCFSEGIGDETLGGEVGTMQVAVSKADASDVDFSCDPYRHQFPSVIQQVDLRVLQWATYRERLFSLFILLHTGTNRCLSGTIGIDEASSLSPTLYQFGWTRLSCHNERFEMR